jgi:segregation and condensation protein A
MATALALRLKRLEAFREAAAKLMALPQLQRDIFHRGDPEPIAQVKQPQWTATLYDLLSAYAAQRQQQALGHVRVKQRNVWSLAEARSALERLIGEAMDWTSIDEFLVRYVVEPSMVTTARASSFAVTLEMVREGLIELNQHTAFAPIYLRKRAGAPSHSDEASDARASGEANQ